MENLPWKWNRYGKGNGGNLIRIEDAAGNVIISGYCKNAEHANAIVAAVNNTPAAAQGEPEAWKITFKDGSESVKDKYYSIHHYVAAGCIATPLYAAAPAAVPEGWKLVPIEPTESMVIAGFESVPSPNPTFTPMAVWDEYEAMSGCQQAAFRAKLCWAAMLAAAPETWKELPSQATPSAPDRVYAFMNDVWSAAGGAPGWVKSPEEIIEGVRYLRTRHDRYAEVLPKYLDRQDALALFAEVKTAPKPPITGEPKQEPVSPFEGSTD